MEEAMSKNAVAANAVAASDTSQKDPTKSIANAPLARLEDTTHAPAEPTFDSEVGDLQEAAKNATNAEKAFKRTFVNLCKKLYTFGKKYELEPKKIEAWLDEKGLKVTAKANNWTPVVKLAFAEQKADGTWEVSNQQVNKYANVMRYAETVTFTSLEDWIGDRTLTELIAAARLANRETSENGEKTEDKIKHHLNVLEAKWEPFFKKGWSKVDLTEAPVQKGPVQIMANVEMMQAKSRPSASCRLTNRSSSICSPRRSPKRFPQTNSASRYRALGRFIRSLTSCR